MVKTRTPPAFASITSTGLAPVLVLASCTLMSACGDIKGALDFVDDRDSFAARSAMLQDRSNTAYRAVPETGSSTYSGEASLGVGSRSEGVVLIGQAEVTVDYANAEVSGSLGNFSGFDMNEEFSDYNGTLVLQSGVLGRNNPNDIDAQVVGTLRGETYVIGVDAFWDGHLKGTPIVGVLGDTTPGSSQFELNGRTVPGGIIIAASD